MMVYLILLIINTLTVASENADSTKTFRPSLDAYPYIYYTPETQFAFGAGGVVTFHTQKDSLLNPSNLTFSGYYSTVKSYELSLISNLFFDKNRMASTIDIRYSNTVDRFYGIGGDSPDLGTEEYIISTMGGIIDFQLPPALIISTRAGFAIEYRDYKIKDTKNNPYLNSDSEYPGQQGGIVSGLGLIWVWDNRDQVFFPNYGGFTQVKALFYTKDLGSDFTFSWLEVDARRYWSFAPDKVLAVQSYLSSTGGSPPFFKLPALGGSSIMRGYFQGRFRDNNYFAFQAEYRQYIWRRLGFVLFAGAGDVTSVITGFQLTKFKPCIGAGLRFLFNKEQKINIRMDIGFGRDTNGVYFGIQEAF